MKVQHSANSHLKFVASTHNFNHHCIALAWHSRWEVSEILWILLAYPCGKEPTDRVWKRRSGLCPSHSNLTRSVNVSSARNWSSRLLVQEVTLAAGHSPAANIDTYIHIAAATVVYLVLFTV